MTEPRWLDETQQKAWRAMLVFSNRALPEIQRPVKEQGLLVVHYTILVSLSEAEGRTMRLTDLADAANLSPSRLTHRLKTMIEGGHVEVAADEHDKRVKHATLTDAGMALLERLAPLHVEIVQRVIFDHLDEAETAALANAMSKVAASLCDHDLFLPRDQIPNAQSTTDR